MSETRWKKTKYIKTSDAGPFDTHTWEYELLLPTPLADWDVFDYWEKERVESMSQLLEKDDILFDVGAEHGWMSVVFARFCDVFLIEPTKEFWPNIKETWIHNCTTSPKGTFCGLIGTETNFTEEINYKGWPNEAGGPLIEKNKYQYINEHEEGTRIITIDDLVSRSGVKPTALSIDVEGFELSVLEGAMNTLLMNDMKVWISIHPDLMMKALGKPAQYVLNLMDAIGYHGVHLATDHEEHWFFLKKP